LNFGANQPDVYDFPKSFVNTVVDGCKQIGSKLQQNEIQSLHHISQSSPWADFNGVLSAYLDDKKISDYGRHHIVFQDDDLQRQVFEELKAREGFEEGIKNAPQLYGRMMEIHPQLYYDFNPSAHECDAKAFSQMIDGSNGLRKHKSSIRLFKDSVLSAEKIDKIVDAARDTLRETNPKMYTEHVEDTNDYYLIANFDTFKKELQSNCAENKPIFPELHN
jgi:hypothetical protein